MNSIGQIDFVHLAIITAETILLAFVFGVVFRLRKILGKGIIYAVFGMIQYIQIFLSSTIYFEIAPGIIVSPGSVVIFTGIMYAILMFYIREDAAETRRLIIAMFISNAIMTVLLMIYDWHIQHYPYINPNEAALSFMHNSAWVMFVNTLGLILDVFLIIFIYEKISKLIKPLYLRIFVAMGLMQAINSVFFMGLSFLNSPLVLTLIYSAIIGKLYTGIFFSAFVYIYLKYIEPDVFTASDLPYKGVFQSLTYRQKYEMMLEEKQAVQRQTEKALELNELKYQTLIRMSPVGIFLTDASGYTIYVNPRWCEITGLSLEEALGFGWLEATDPEDRKWLAQGWEKATLRSDSSTVEYRFLSKDGGITWVLGQAIPEIDSEGEVVGYVGTITDITLLKNFEGELRRAKNNAEEGERLKTMFLQNISHEIRTPLNAICGSANLLNDNYFSSEQKDSLIEIIQTSSNKLLSIVTDILAVASLETRQEKTIIRKTTLNGIFAELEEKFSPQAEEKGIGFKVNMGLGYESSVLYTDRSKLLRLMSNLLSNAIKFTSKGSVHIGYTVNDGNIVLYVQDTGIGIDQSLQAHIFDSFRQADSHIQYDFGGTGLGLCIVKGFAELLGGTVRVESQPGKGSVFYVTLPFTNEK
jgi:PAS domain S-box-containing protein